LLAFGCKKVPRSHEIIDTWDFHYVENTGVQQWAPNTIDQIRVTFKRKAYSLDVPVNTAGGKSQIYNDGSINIETLNSELRLGDSTSSYWEDLFITEFSLVTSYEIKGDTLNLYSETSTLKLSK
jgi:hypothetical protein